MNPDGGGDASGDRDGSGAAPELLWGLPPELLLAVLSRLPPNEVALSVRRTCRAAAQHFAEEHQRTAAIGQPLPPHAASEPLDEAEAAFRGLTLHSKLRALHVAAASGNLVNLEVAWRLLRPCVFPELMQTGFYLQQLLQASISNLEVAAAAVVQSSNALAVLSWLLDRCPGLVHSPTALQAAAQHCPLPQLQQMWALLSAADSSLQLDDSVLNAAAKSTTPDALPKLEWLLQQGSCSLSSDTAAAAATSGDLPRLQWLRERGCPFDSWQVLEAALAHADLSVADWLLDEAGCPNPGPHNTVGLVSAAATSGSMAKLRWLQVRGVATLPEPPGWWPLEAAARSGRLETMRFFHREGGDQLLSKRVMAAAIRSSSLETAAYLLEAGCPVEGFGWYEAGRAGDLAAVRWLLEEARLPALGNLSDLVMAWPESRQSNMRLLEAVQLIAPPGSIIEGPAQLLGTAAVRSDVSLLRYLHEELGCELGPSVLRAAACNGCEAVVEWLMERGCAEGAEQALLDGCYLEAGERGDRTALECLRSQGLQWSEELLSMAVMRWRLPLPVVQWMWGQGAPISEQQLRAVRGVLEGQPGQEGLEMMEWLEGQVESV